MLCSSSPPGRWSCLLGPLIWWPAPPLLPWAWVAWFSETSEVAPLSGTMGWNSSLNPLDLLHLNSWWQWKPCCPLRCLWSHSSVFLNEKSCLKLNAFIGPSIESQKSDSLLPFCFIFAPFSLSWQHLCCYKILKSFVGFYLIHRGPAIRQKIHRSFLDNCIAIPGFCWDGWLDQCLIPKSV